MSMPDNLRAGDTILGIRYVDATSSATSGAETCISAEAVFAIHLREGVGLHGDCWARCNAPWHF